jgi:hypothetical protein
MRGKVALILALVWASSFTAEAWLLDGVPIHTGPGLQGVCAVASDGSGGAIITWQSGSDKWDIWTQRVSPSGLAQWTYGGVVICDALDDQGFPVIVSDGCGGAIVVWVDWRSDVKSVYAQRVDSSGLVDWTLNGVAICTVAVVQDDPAIVSDGSGGVIIAWDDPRGDCGIYAQRVDSSGLVTWTLDGVPICTATGNQDDAAIIADGSGGTIIAWTDSRNGDSDIYAQRVNASGEVQWAVDGVPVCTAPGSQWASAITSDDSGGAIVIWQDTRNPANSSDIYAQRIDSSGGCWWVSDGVSICTVPGDQTSIKIASGGEGSVIAVWKDYRSGSWDIYAQLVNSVGEPKWTGDGVPICTATGYQQAPAIVSDGSEGAIISWMDFRGFYSDIYAQRVNASGLTEWLCDGVPICTALDDQWNPAMASDDSGGAIIAWQDCRTDSAGDIYAQRVVGSGSTGVVNWSPQRVSGKLGPSPWPNPFMSWVSVGGCEKEMVTVYNTSGQKVGEYTGDRVGSDLGPGVYFVSASSAGLHKIVKVK